MFLTVNYFVEKLTIPTDYMDEMWIRRKVKFLKIYDVVNSNRLSHCVFLQASLPLPPFFPFTDTKPKGLHCSCSYLRFFAIFSRSSPNCFPHLCSPRHVLILIYTINICIHYIYTTILQDDIAWYRI